MRVFLCGNGPNAVEIARYLAGHPDAELIGGAVHPAARSRNANELRGLVGAPVLEGREINSDAGLETLAGLEPDVLLSVHFGYLIGKRALAAATHAINVHPAYLPHGRGANPNVWAIVEGSPAGVTIHVMEEALDTGDILAQCEVPYDGSDTGESLYARLLEAELELFADMWPRFVAGEIEPRPQATGGSSHIQKELLELDRLDLDEVLPVRTVLNRLRARSFPPHDGCFVEEADGKRTYYRLQPYRRTDDPTS